MIKRTIEQVKAEAQQFKMYWDSDPEFRKGCCIYAAKALAVGVAITVPYILGHRAGQAAGIEKGYNICADRMIGCLNEYKVPMPDRLRNDIAAGKCLPFGMPTK